MSHDTNTSRRAFLRTGASAVALPALAAPALAATVPADTALDAWLTTLTLEELNVIFDALQAARDGWQSIYNQPRCGGLVSDVLDAEMESLERRSQAVFDEAQRREPGSNRERDHKATIIVKWIVATGGFELLPEAIAVAAMPSAVA